MWLDRPRLRICFLSHAEWVTRVKDTVIVSKVVARHAVDGSRADMAVSILTSRLARHIADRVTDAKARDSWCWRWVGANMSRVVAILELHGCLRRDLKSAAADATLLRPQNPDVHFTADEHPNVQGSYLYNNAEKAEVNWIRSGKVTGRALSVRCQEHRLGSELKTPASQASQFYKSYPAVASSNGDCHADLSCVVGIAWDPVVASSRQSLCNQSSSGILVWDKSTMAAMRKAKMSSAQLSLEQKQLTAEGYLAICSSSY